MNKTSSDRDRYQGQNTKPGDVASSWRLSTFQNGTAETRFWMKKIKISIFERLVIQEFFLCLSPADHILPFH